MNPSASHVETRGNGGPRSRAIGSAGPPATPSGMPEYHRTKRQERTMKTLGWKITTLAGLVSVALPCSASAQDAPKDPVKGVRVDASVPRERQIALALSAAPTEVSNKATVYILGPAGYEKARDGTNGVSCLIERSFAGGAQVSAAPACFDAEGSRTLVHTWLRREELRAQGKSEAEIKDDIAKG